MIWVVVCVYGMYWFGLWVVFIRCVIGVLFFNIIIIGVWMIYVNEIYMCKFKID